MSGRARARRPEFSKFAMKSMALDRIRELSDLSQVTGDERLSRRYNEMMIQIGKRMDITLEKGMKKKFCKKCYTSYGKTSTIRLRNGMLEVRCGYCGDVRRIPYRVTR